MSFWYDVTKEYIDLSDDCEDIHLFLYDDKLGNVYASVKVRDIIELLLDNCLIH